MEKIKGIIKSTLGFKLEKLGDLLKEEGPILSHFANQRNEDFLFSWVDENEQYHRWMLSKTTNEQLYQFFQQKITLRDLIQTALDEIVYFIDIDGELSYNNITITSIQHIPSVYLPSEKSFFKASQFEPYASNLKNYLQLHFNRLYKLYATTDLPSLSVAEPTIPSFKKR